MADRVLKIAVLGSGRMGQQLVQVIDLAADCEVGGTWSRSSNTDLATLLGETDVAIDFTLAEATAEIAATAAEQQTPLVCGVTGLDRAAEYALEVAAQHIALLYARNMSRGISVMSTLMQSAATALGTDFKTKIHETHHVHKKDAPSGTAIALREALGDLSVDIESFREGEVLGNHVVRFASGSESLEIAHSVSDRRVFAEGAVTAARWLVKQAPGLYSMADIS